MGNPNHSTVRLTCSSNASGCKITRSSQQIQVSLVLLLVSAGAFLTGATSLTWPGVIALIVQGSEIYPEHLALKQTLEQSCMNCSSVILPANQSSPWRLPLYYIQNNFVWLAGLKRSLSGSNLLCRLSLPGIWAADTYQHLMLCWCLVIVICAVGMVVLGYILVLPPDSLQQSNQWGILWPLGWLWSKVAGGEWWQWGIIGPACGHHHVHCSTDYTS